MIVDQTQWGHIAVTGADRVRFLQGMCTADVTRLATGAFTRASMLDTKGRVTSIIEIVQRGDDLLIHCEPDLTHKTIQLLKKHAIMDDVEFTEIDLPVYRVWEDPESVWQAPPIFASPAGQGPLASPADIEILRVEAGMPRYGVDVSEDHFPFESLLARHIDYDKGCYLGQEPISRVHFRGNPNKGMRGLVIAGSDAVAPGSPVSHSEREHAGDVTSSVVSPSFGPIALAYLHRSIFAPGNQVSVAGRDATVVELPFKR